ncbi:hypothetical protein COUCH_11465 [Couchioplanes caeruleus]|uniref:hypothetical protein n=1 Tax=Couchioplanes caeruleus TaxID=56438 RepID=UPI0020C11D28|nr:hypothetical protein [Couchioplanes caeruleus]UQU66840.1 hypothetical protein COUCH_11465 [Couchioplanes caeruleus]
MTFWLDPYTRFKSLTGVDPVLYERMRFVSTEVTERVTRCFAGQAWLRRRFPARSYVNMRLLPHGDATVGVELVKTETRGGGGPSGPKTIRCDLRIPTSWLAEPGDGLLSLRLFQAMLHALHVIGEHYDIGTPAVVGSGGNRGDSEVWDPFGPPPPPPSYAHINAHLERLAASLSPDQLLLVVKEPTSATIARQCHNVRQALGAVVDQHTLTAPDAKATAWTIQTPS